jgi:hypothetical protein
MSLSNLLSKNNYKLYAFDFITNHTNDTLFDLTYQGDGFVNIVNQGAIGHKDGKNRGLTFKSHNFVSTGAGDDINTQISSPYYPPYDLYTPILVNVGGLQEEGTCILRTTGLVEIKRGINANFPAGNIGLFKFSINYVVN